MNNFEEEEKQKESPELPVEMWTEVIKYLPNHRELSLVSTTIHKAVKSIRHNNIFASIDCSDVKSSIESVEEKVQKQSELSIQLVSPNLCILDFLTKHGNRVKVLKIENQCKLKDFLNILSLVPNCESLDIATIQLNEDNSCQNADSVTMMKLNELHIDTCNESNDIFTNHLNTPALTKLIVDFTLQSLREVNKILDKNHQLKILEIKETKQEQSTNYALDSLKNLTLDKIKITRYSWCGDADILLIIILRNQPKLKNLQAHNIRKNDVEAICTLAPQLESLKLNTFHCNFETLANISKFTNLRKLSLKHMILYMRSGNSSMLEPDFFEDLVQNNKQLQHLHLNEQFLYHKDSLKSVLVNLKQLESLKVHGNYWILLNSADPYLSLDIDNANLKVLKFYDNIPLRLFGKFIFSYPNLEILETKSLKFIPETSESEIKIPKIDGSQMMLDLIKKAKESICQKRIVIADLIETFLNTEEIFSASDLLKLQLTLIQLGWPKLKELEIQSRESFADIEDQIEDLLNANQELRSLEIIGRNKSHNEEKFKERFYEKFQDRFNKITNEDCYLSFKNISEQMKAIKIKNYSKYDLVLKDERIRNIHLNFSEKSTEKKQIFENFIKLMKDFGEKILKLELTGLLSGNQIVQLLDFVPNCEDLHLNDFQMTSNLSRVTRMQKLKAFKIYKHGKILKFLHVPKLHSLIIKGLEFQWDEKLILRKFLEDQKNLKILELDIASLSIDIDEDFSLPYKLVQLKLEYEECNSKIKRTEMEEIILNILKGQTELKSLDVGYMTKNILQAITKDMEKLKTLKFKSCPLKFSELSFEICPNVEFMECSDKFDNPKELAQIFPNVKALNGSAHFIPFKILLDTARYFEQLENLTIRSQANYWITEGGKNEIPSFVNSNLRELTFDCRSQENRVDTLLKCLPNLNKLALHFVATNVKIKISPLNNWLVNSKNKIEYFYCKMNKIIQFNSTELNKIAEKENLKFLCLVGFKIENTESLVNTLKNSFEIVEIDQDAPRILLVKSKEILQKVFESSWNETLNRSNNQIRRILGLNQVKEKNMNGSNDSNSDSEESNLYAASDSGNSCKSLSDSDTE